MLCGVMESNHPIPCGKHVYSVLRYPYVLTPHSAHHRNRTHGLLFTKEPLYQLS